MAVGGQVRGFHDLDGAGKNGTVALFNRETEHAAQKAGGFAGLTVVFAVDAHVGQLEAHDDGHGFTGQFSDGGKVPGVDECVADHEGAAAGNDFREGKVIAQILLVDAASGHEAQLGVGGGHGFDGFQAAVGLGGEEFDHAQAQFDGCFHVRGGGAAGEDGDETEQASDASPAEAPDAAAEDASMMEEEAGSDPETAESEDPTRESAPESDEGKEP